MLDTGLSSLIVLVKGEQHLYKHPRKLTLPPTTSLASPHQISYADMKAFLVLVGLLSVVYSIVVAVPIHSDSSEESKLVPNDTNESASNELVYLVKDVSYEVGVVDTLDLGNSSQLVIVKPEDRVETADIDFWASKNESTPEDNITSSTAPADTTVLSLTEPEQVDKQTTSSSRKSTEWQVPTTLANKDISA